MSLEVPINIYQGCTAWLTTICVINAKLIALNISKDHILQNEDFVFVYVPSIGQGQSTCTWPTKASTRWPIFFWSLDGVHTWHVYAWEDDLMTSDVNMCTLSYTNVVPCVFDGHTCVYLWIFVWIIWITCMWISFSDTVRVHLLNIWLLLVLCMSYLFSYK